MRPGMHVDDGVGVRRRGIGTRLRRGVHIDSRRDIRGRGAPQGIAGDDERLPVLPIHAARVGALEVSAAVEYKSALQRFHRGVGVQRAENAALVILGADDGHHALIGAPEVGVEVGEEVVHVLRPGIVEVARVDVALPGHGGAEIVVLRRDVAVIRGVHDERHHVRKGGRDGPGDREIVVFPARRVHVAGRENGGILPILGVIAVRDDKGNIMLAVLRGKRGIVVGAAQSRPRCGIPPPRGR